MVTCPECVHRTTVPKLKPSEAGPSEEPPEEAEESVAAHREHVSGEMDVWQPPPNPWKDEAADEEEEFSLSGPRGDGGELDMTPMVDVTFLLLIFFMITASFSLQKSLQTSPPEPDEEGAAQALTLEDLEEESVVVEIDAEDNIRVDDEPVAGIGELIDVLAAKIGNEGKTEMLIESDAQATHGTVVAVTDAGIEVSMQRIRHASKRSAD